MPLPPPTTTSPGKLCIEYSTGGVQHEVCSNLQDGADITDLTVIESEAIALAELIQPMCVDVVHLQGWRLADPTGVTLAEGTFIADIVGTFVAPTGAFISESATIGLAGKGQPAIGLQQGQTRFTVFAGYLNPPDWSTPRVPLADIPGAGALQAHLDGSTFLGADFYGSPGTWKGYCNTQVNAHYQKTLGV